MIDKTSSACPRASCASDSATSSDRLRDACGVFGIIGSITAAEETALGLHALQHRGQDGCGIVSYDGKHFHAKRALGLVGDSLASRAHLSRLQGDMALGHNRYATSGAVSESNLQPMFAELDIGGVAIAHNGNFTNALTVRRKLVAEGSIFQSYSDSEVLIHLLARSRGNLTSRLLSVLCELQGGFAIGMLAQGKLIGFRDQHGIRPLLLGRTRSGAMIIASESCAFDIIDASLEREVSPGEVVVISLTSGSQAELSSSHRINNGATSNESTSNESTSNEATSNESTSNEATSNGSTKALSREDLRVASLRFASPAPRRSCVFERIYFSRPDSLVSDVAGGSGLSSIYQVRKRIGAALAEESLSAFPDSRSLFDVVVPVPDSGVAAALGFAEHLRLPLDFAIIRNHYVGRTFIEPQQEIRHFGVRLKHNADSALLRGKRVLLIDDSLVRGTTSSKIIELVRQAGAIEVHMRIASPPITNPCYYGVDTPERAELLASHMTVEQIASRIRCDSLAFLSAAGLFRALNGASTTEPNGAAPTTEPNGATTTSSCVSNEGWCSACFTGDYPVSLVDNEFGKDAYGQLSLLSHN